MHVRSLHATFDFIRVKFKALLRHLTELNDPIKPSLSYPDKPVLAKFENVTVKHKIVDRNAIAFY